MKVLRTSVVLKSKCERTFSERTHIPLFINLFIPLIELEHPLKLSNKRTHMQI